MGNVRNFAKEAKSQNLFHCIGKRFTEQGGELIGPTPSESGAFSIFSRCFAKRGSAIFWRLRHLGNGPAALKRSSKGLCRLHRVQAKAAL